MTFTFVLSKPIPLLFLHFYLLVFILEVIPVLPSVVHAQLQFLFELNTIFKTKNTIITSKKSSDEFTATFDKLLLTFFSLLSFNFQHCILTFLQLMDRGTFQKQTFHSLFENTCEYTILCYILQTEMQFTIISALTGKHLHWVGLEGKACPSGCS